MRRSAGFVEDGARSRRASRVASTSRNSEVRCMNALYWLGLGITVALFVYLLVALLRPEKF
jgi:K+-transporting ATPase KdpF subunit